MRFGFALLVLWFIVSSVLADVLVLNDGTRLEGNVKKTDGGYEVTGGDGKVTKVPANRVKTIELGKSSSAQSSMAALASLRRSVEVLSDINQVIDRYQRFVENNKDPQIQLEARKDLSAWIDRRDRGLVKQGSKWVTPAEAAEMVARGNAAAEQARQFLRDGRQPEAESAIQNALGDDPTNPGALYLRGLILYRADKLTDSRKAFEAVNSQVTKHPPTLNNLAVILWRQKQQAGALNLYDQAMQAAPVNKYILDNVADALGTLPEDQQKNRAVVRVTRRFAEQDSLLQQQLSPQGWFRWGSSWVDQKTIEQLKEQEKSVRAKVDAMQADFDQSKARIGQIDVEVAQNTREMQDLQSRSLYYDPNTKRYVTYPLPQSYYELQRKNQDLRQEQAALKAKLDTLREQAKRVQQEFPVPRFTGVQQIVGVEGMPEQSLGGNSTTQPSTSPN